MEERTRNIGVHPPLRYRWRISGRVQGVGFRPFVFRLAGACGLHGAVWNDSAGVVIEAQGEQRQLDSFHERLQAEAPAAAVIRNIERQEMPPRAGENNFQILQSSSVAPLQAEAAVDIAVCPECMAEVRDAGNPRRHGYILTNCTNCGPRFSMIRAIPYDRANTTMAAFDMCAACRAEYENPADRRFHAQPTCCQECGPKPMLVDGGGRRIDEDAVAGAARRLVSGQIVAIKGIGGYHLAARADDQAAVSRLRQIKHRPAKPFAIMAASLEAAQALVQLSDEGLELIASPAAPIVIARRRGAAGVAEAVAPGNHRLGVMIPYTPLHHLIFDALAKDGVQALVMTSGNDVDDPLVFNDGEAIAALGGMCDAILRHDRPIERAIDDSVVIDAASGPIMVRRSRGYVPEPLALPPNSAAPGLAVGAEMKCTVGVHRDGLVILSQHLGNITQARAFGAFKRAIKDLCNLFAITPRWIAHDMHPAYLSTGHAKRLAEDWEPPLIAVQHHHAHAAAVMAEHGMTGPVVAIVCDGTGYGPDGTIWGGEVLLAELCDFRRVARLRPMPLPGGDAAARQPWRSALAMLHMAFGEECEEVAVSLGLGNRQDVGFVVEMLKGNVSCVASSSTGRVFDAVAAILGICRENRFDAEAPTALESMAALAGGADFAQVADRFEIRQFDGLSEIDLAPLMRHLAHASQQRESAAELALLFHQTLAAAFAAAAARAAQSAGLDHVILSGGCMCNEIFADALVQRLEHYGLKAIRHLRLPPNDGSIAYGQAAVATARLSREISTT